MYLFVFDDMFVVLIFIAAIIGFTSAASDSKVFLEWLKDRGGIFFRYLL